MCSENKLSPIQELLTSNIDPIKLIYEEFLPVLLNISKEYASPLPRRWIKFAIDCSCLNKSGRSVPLIPPEIYNDYKSEDKKKIIDTILEEIDKCIKNLKNRNVYMQEPDFESALDILGHQNYNLIE
jgi:hypothetical protein